MTGEIIRAGDKTSHGGTVVEGSQTDICMGKPIAFVGHMTYCPKCKGNFPIIEGVMTTTFYGKGVAVDGMKTACGAVLLASQSTDIVQWSSGSDTPHRVAETYLAPTSDQHSPSNVSSSATVSEQGEDGIETERYFSLVDGNNNPIDEYSYDLQAANVLHTKAGRYAVGNTVSTKGKESTQLVTWLDTDSGSRA